VTTPDGSNQWKKKAKKKVKKIIKTNEMETGKKRDRRKCTRHRLMSAKRMGEKGRSSRQSKGKGKGGTEEGKKKELGGEKCP